MRLTIPALLLLASAGAALAQTVPPRHNNPELAPADVANGRAIAERWCSACHVVSATQQRAQDSTPTFASIARRGDLNDERLTGFLTDPHPQMPNLSLSRRDMVDLIGYIRTLAP